MRPTLRTAKISSVKVSKEVDLCAQSVRGRRVGAAGRLAAGSVDWFRTLVSSRRGGGLKINDLRHHVRRTGPQRLLLILLDSSGSTLAGQGLSVTKGVVASLLERAYLERIRVGMLQIYGRAAQLRLAPGRALKQTSLLLEAVQGGGGTPLRHGLELARTVLERERHRFPEQKQQLMLLTDGRSRDRVDDIDIPCQIVVIDVESGPVRLGRCRDLAATLNGRYLSTAELPIKGARKR